MKRCFSSHSGSLGIIFYYDENNEPVGESRPGALGCRVLYNRAGQYIGETRPGLMGVTMYFDPKGHYVGEVRPGGIVDYIYDAMGRLAGEKRRVSLGITYTFFDDGT